MKPARKPPKAKVQIKLPETYSSYHLSDGEKYKFLIICGAGLMAVGYLFYHSFIVSLFLACLSCPALVFYRNYLAEKRKRVLKDQFRDVLYSISASVAAGRQMPEALKEAEKNMRLIYTEEALITKELAGMVKRLNEYREPEEKILKDFAQRTGIEDIADFVDIYLTSRETGGDLIKILTKASETIMEKIAIEREIKSVMAQKQFETKILTSIPFIIILFLQLMSPDYLSVMYEGIKGRMLMTAALFGIGISYFWSMKLTRIDV